jgi:hypothetical protein
LNPTPRGEHQYLYEGRGGNMKESSSLNPKFVNAEDVLTDAAQLEQAEEETRWPG